MTTSPAEHLPRCRRHMWVPDLGAAEANPVLSPTGDLIGYELPPDAKYTCAKCRRPFSAVASKRGRNNRSRGNRAELSVARKYGGEKVGQLGLPEDIRGDEYRTQVKTHQRLAPTEWRKAFTALEAVTDGRTPRLIVRFLQPGVPADDYIIIKGSSWLDRFGRDEREDAA